MFKPRPQSTSSHRLGGIHRPLERAAVYGWLQRLAGADAGRRRFVDEYLRPQPRSRILDIGCGPGSLLAALPADVDYVGFDLNPAYIMEARRRFSDRGRFYCARVGEGEEAEASFDLVVAGAILHHLDDGQAAELVASAHRALRPGGHLVTLDAVRHAGQKLTARALIAMDRGRRVRTAEGYRLLLPARCFDTVDTSLLTDLARIPYSHFVMRARKT